MIPHSLVMLETLVENGVLTKEAAERILDKRNAMLDEIAATFVEDGHDKTASVLGDMIAGVRELGRGKINQEMLHSDPTLYHALNKAYQSGAADAKRMLPQSSMSMGSPWRTAAALVALATGARMAGGAALSVTERMKRRELEGEVARSKSQIFDLNPQLLADKGAAEQAFDELARFAPAIAASPHVATNFVSSALTRKLYGEAAAIDPTQASQLLQAQKTYESVRESINPGQTQMGMGLSKDVGEILKQMTSGNLF